MSVKLHVQNDLMPRIIEGISPEISFTSTDEGVIMTVTTRTGTKSVLIPKGPQGETYVMTLEDRQAIAELIGTIDTNVYSNALKVEGLTLGKQGGMEVDSGSEYYHNNAKYYYEKTADTDVGTLAERVAALEELTQDAVLMNYYAYTLDEDVVSGGSKSLTKADIGIIDPPGYILAAVRGFYVSSNWLHFRSVYEFQDGNICTVANSSASAYGQNQTVGLKLTWVKEALVGTFPELSAMLSNSLRGMTDTAEEEPYDE